MFTYAMIMEMKKVGWMLPSMVRRYGRLGLLWYPILIKTKMWKKYVLARTIKTILNIIMIVPALQAIIMD